VGEVLQSGGHCGFAGGAQHFEEEEAERVRFAGLVDDVVGAPGGDQLIDDQLLQARPMASHLSGRFVVTAHPDCQLIMYQCLSWCTIVPVHTHRILQPGSGLRVLEFGCRS